jgi:conjugal transfer pilus assembly protein TraB
VLADIQLRLRGLADAMSPRVRQWAALGLISAAAVAILWAVFAMGSGNGAQRGAAASAKTDLKPTNVDLMAPGSQVRPEELWVGKAGRELEQYKSEREEQRRVNRENKEGQDTILRRFAELESRLKATPPADTARPSAPVAPAAVPAPALPTPRFPPEAALGRQTGLPPPPPPPPSVAMVGPRPGMPVGAPGFLSEPFVPPQPALIRVTLPNAAKAQEAVAEAGRSSTQTTDTFLPVSFTRGVLLGGLDAPTGGQSQTNPHPVLIRLSDNSVLPNRYRAEYRECFVVAAGYGDISSERAYLRTESLSCVRTDGTALEVKIQGSVYGEDGKVGMRGRLITKQGQMLANALFAGVVSGIGQGISTSNTSYSSSALGSVATTSGNDALKAGVGSGVGKALDRLAQYYIKLAEQTFPIIEIDAGREIDVVLTKGVRIDGADAGKASSTASPTASPTRLTSHDHGERSDLFTKGAPDEE